jgi:hypothetical protein
MPLSKSISLSTIACAAAAGLRPRTTTTENLTQQIFQHAAGVCTLLGEIPPILDRVILELLKGVEFDHRLPGLARVGQIDEVDEEMLDGLCVSLARTRGSPSTLA